MTIEIRRAGDSPSARACRALAGCRPVARAGALTYPGATAGPFPSQVSSSPQLRRAGSRPPGGSFGGLAEMPQIPDRLPVLWAWLVVLGGAALLWGGALALLLAVLR
jgi:hypothetical protein